MLLFLLIFDRLRRGLADDGLVAVEVVHLIFVRIVVAEGEVEDDADGDRGAANASVHPEESDPLATGTRASEMAEPKALVKR